jgi:endonuclease YncB( thermonuclease family)
VGVSDGDTLTILNDRKQQIKVRLAEIDTPESAQPYGTRAKQELSRLVHGKTVIVKVRDIDRYGRIVGRVYEGGIDVNAEMSSC